MNDLELLPCPFCGWLPRCVSMATDGPLSMIMCPNLSCGCAQVVNDLDEASRRWNRRQAPPPSEKA